ncbi:(2E,6E)-farnesyl diphosphate synthase [Bacterioplanes sanyensis]|uniref:polyprenyl synthetase family protein n=1 Tax=Bacterioplanes sanyensis TaxID=1249553 RepID=UPI00167276BD|nr:farnesyl diphosphate synthase [Bacterioplanes sanyensis]GGY47383.1 (2E,6E)-farnesyl diphosphate synthase [Bacterioplanes sanyensis]
MTLQDTLIEVQQRCQQQLQQALTQLDIGDQRLADAMHYGLLNGGKRLRPLLVYAGAEAAGARWEDVDAAAVAVEMMHSYSLVHDDLPAMDNDDLRRGKPTCHIAFDEAAAILAGDALQAAAFEHLAQAPVSETLKLRWLQLLARAAGAAGMVAGQAIDLGHVGKLMTLDELQRMHEFKTGALITAALEMGAAAGDLSEAQAQALRLCGDAIGLAFQVQDDILDIEGDTATLGKQQGADIARDKPTYPALLGIDGARQKARELTNVAIAQLRHLPGQCHTLEQLAHYVINRDH